MRRLLVLCMVLVGAAATWWAPAAAADPFGIHDLDLAFTDAQGQTDSQAGSHPYAMTISFGVNTEPRPGGGVEVTEAVKDLELAQIAGFVGNPTAVPTCSQADFLTTTSNAEGAFVPSCPDIAAVGVVGVGTITGGLVNDKVWTPVYSLVPPPGAPAELGFWTAGVPITISLGVNSAPPYNVVGGPTNISQIIEFESAKLILWGVPADPSHDPLRGICANGRGEEPSSLGDCPLGGTAVKPFLTLPRACAGPLETSWTADSWVQPGIISASGGVLTHNSAEPPAPQGMTGCAKIGFSPEITAKPSSLAAESPSGLDFNIDVNRDEGLENPSYKAISDADIEKAVVTLPEGMTVNPSSANGLNVCTEEQLAAEDARSAVGEGCPDASNLGTIEVETPLLKEILKGRLYLAKPYENPEHTLLALYVVIKSAQLGISVKLPLKVEPDPRTGRLVTTSEGIPQLPFTHFRLHFREGARSPLVTPPSCGSKEISATLFPSSGGPPVVSSSAFEIISGPNAGPCPPEATPPFHPVLLAGTENNAGGTFSPFDADISRTDSEQEVTHFSIKLPPGVTGRLAGIPFCGDAEIAAAKAREGTEHGGQEELEHPSCPAASAIGRTLVGAGVGSVLTYVPGKVYLAGPYKGSNLSIVAITAAKAGPFDLGTVVIREALKVNPETAEVSVDAGTSDPIPHIIEGIPVHLRDIRVYVDRPEFVKNPTNCEPTSVASTVLGSGTDFASEADDRPVTVTTRFQAADCASLQFKPKLKLMLKGPTKRAGLPKLKAVVTARPGDANIGRAVVTLPRSEFLEQGHIGTTCTRVQFNAGGGNGEQCPARSVYGRAVAVTPLLDEPLSGPVFLRSNGGERKLPDLVAALHSKDINIDLQGFIKSLHPKGSSISRIRTIFAAVPDAPVSKFTLEMFGGKKSLLINSTNLCKGKHRAISTFVGQNGKRDETRPPVQVHCKKKHGKHKRRAGHKRIKAAKKKGSARLAVAFHHRLAW